MRIFAENQPFLAVINTTAMEITELIAFISFSVGLPTVITAWALGKRYLNIIERRTEIQQQELAVTERRLILEERERELEIYKLELEIRHLEQESGEKPKLPE